jgi:hypothetical protein
MARFYNTMRKESTEMRNFGAGIIAMLCLVAIAGCTTNKSIANITTPSNKLQLAVGTINDSAGTLGIGGVSLNVVTTFRNTLGNSAFIHPGFYMLTGPGGTIVAPNPSNPCDQLFGYGDLPGCEGDNLGEAIVGVPPAYTPPSSIGGYALGFIQTGAPATAGAYTASTTVTVNGQNVNYSASATLGTNVMANAGGVTGFVSDHNGGGTFTFSNPLKAKLKLHHHGFLAVSEFLILVSNSVISSSPLIVAAVEAPGGSTTATIVGTGSGCPASGIPIPCGGNTTYVIDADYPLVEDGPPASHSQTPTLDGPNGSADISVSTTFPINEN